eukprot:1469909-Alexandrium_andersonii.AAC.1
MRLATIAIRSNRAAQQSQFAAIVIRSNRNRNNRAVPKSKTRSTARPLVYRRGNPLQRIHDYARVPGVSNALGKR